MKYLDEYRDAAVCERLLGKIRARASRRWTLMEVCGGQTHGLLRWGIDDELAGIVELIHGPGCPVCVTPLESIDHAIELARRDDVVLTSFGDMLRVPGSAGSLQDARGVGAGVRIVYSPVDAVQLAARCPDKHIVFFAVGFETTTPATALAVRQADELGLTNFSLLVSHVRVQPAMELLAADEHCGVQGFLAAGHVCTVIGYEEFHAFARRFQLPVVVTGFEPVDLLAGILACVEQLESGRYTVDNQYSRSVRSVGNRDAIRLVDDVFEVCDRPWRGFGNVERGGLALRPQWRAFDAAVRFPRASLPVVEPPECRSGDVLAGRIKPPQCAAFGRSCTPDSPLGAPMVSSEGACAAYYRYANRRTSLDVTAGDDGVSNDVRAAT
ncbi:MAG: hydrogenase formation protein HypD [Planctomycetales bacterium]|nr:hydrogenase formation protein HypD [Planctomycetales bacterium]